MNACLLHRTYHVLDQDCWRYRHAWLSDHHYVSDVWREEFYQRAVESAILGDMWKVMKCEA